MFGPLPNRRTLSLHPDNQESPIHFVDQWVTPNYLHFLRNHYDYTDTFLQQRISVTGQVRKSMEWSIHQLRTLPSTLLLVVLECAGNKRSFLRPRPFGIQWGEGAISQAWWRGVPLRFLLEHAGWAKEAVEVVFTGSDKPKGTARQKEPFQRSLPLDKALDPDTLVAWQMNGHPIPLEHGGPVRLIVPGWYAMASVKWLQEIRVTDQPFQGKFQTEDYVYYPHPDHDGGKTPVTTINVNSIIQTPMDHEELEPDDPRFIRGLAWTGKGIVERVEVSTDGGIQWQSASLERFPHQPYAWVRWSMPWNPENNREYEIFSRARDTSGRMQPMVPFWNRKGYGNNGVARVRVKTET